MPKPEKLGDVDVIEHARSPRLFLECFSFRRIDIGRRDFGDRDRFVEPAINRLVGNQTIRAI